MATADLTSSLRAFAFKTLEEAKQRGATLATVQAATASLADVTAASLSRLSGNVPASSALGVFRAQQAEQQSQPQPTLSGGHDAVTALGLKLQQLERADEAARAAVADGAADALGESVYKMDLINESLAFTIENIQECAHVMALLNRQLKDSAAMQTPAQRDFYRRPADAVASAGDEEKEETGDE